MNVEKKKVAFFGDLDNLHATLANNGRMLDSNEITKALFALGEIRVAFAKMYSHWGTKSEQVQRDLMSAGFELIECPLVDVGGQETKSSTDHEMMRGIDQLIDHSDVDIFVIGSGDRDFLRVLQKVRFAGKEVVLLCTPYGASSDLKRAADNVIEISGVEPWRGGNGNKVIKSWSWAQEEIEAHCLAVFSERYREGIEQTLASLPRPLPTVIEGCLLKAMKQIRIAEDNGKYISLSHIRNLICTPRSPKVIESWAEGVNPSNIMAVLVEMSKTGVLEKRETDDEKSPVTYKVNRLHPFVRWILKRHP